MPRADIPAPFLVALHHLAFPPNLPAGLSPWTLFAIAHDRRNGGAQVRDPITVRRHPTWPEGWLIVDGRHRVAASIAAGCDSILCIEVSACGSSSLPSSSPPSVGSATASSSA